VIVEWDGPAWAAPEHAERIRLQPVDSAPDLARELLGVLARCLANGLIDAEQFQLALPLGRK
jgi:hypothetical protein